MVPLIKEAAIFQCNRLIFGFAVSIKEIVSNFKWQLTMRKNIEESLHLG